MSNYLKQAIVGLSRPKIPFYLNQAADAAVLTRNRSPANDQPRNRSNSFTRETPQVSNSDSAQVFNPSSSPSLYWGEHGQSTGQNFHQLNLNMPAFNFSGQPLV